MSDLADALKQARTENTRLQQYDIPPEHRLTLYRGGCGHEWFKSESDNCPYCHIEQLEAALRQVSNTEGFPSDEAHQDCVDIARKALKDNETP